ncbi:2-oxo-4-hydroxy-4-carboxy-5-ureidoimidazoline decarboxylase [Vibrio mangrovi]|uniref:2-oxo-4-hydroxy-4-carboxy-5-ureidoimidazoline decarboxylase n=1 Tax=Vibrio mangrovi TaxID=474394 RepID=A0A1Y6IT37_9VIBR|nr:2-oxo-4-hydroxy-4-carboxy-5-ureidoimidazoline decarboxylase [Vibrio mangrovi]MDW6004506.1 2-oxo-4-hydroxy-4-carboxy-5-ureidoimidazoline decarboxylase [Vibrio mangrovi]SMS00794.1 Uric acid degradation bifunctional protein [Vibrio mangrovi]
MGSETKTIHLTQTQLAQICTSTLWQQLMLTRMPCTDYSHFCQTADEVFAQLSETDWLEAFAGHPMIGDLATLQKKYSQGKHLSEQEQGQVTQASEGVLKDLLYYNQAYLEKFGFIFIICASKQSAEQILHQLQVRIRNNRNQELLNAATEQQKISHLRMEYYQ